MKNNNIKTKSSFLIFFVACISVIMIIGFSVSLNTKGTYSASTCYKCENGGSTWYSTSNIPGVTCTSVSITYCSSSSSGSSSSSSNTLNDCCTKNGLYSNLGTCQENTNRVCTLAGNACGGCYVPTSQGLNCSDKASTQKKCEDNSNLKCVQDAASGCWYATGEYKDQAACHAVGYHCITSGGKLVPTYTCYKSEALCQSGTNKVCSNYNGCFVGDGADLGDGVSCINGNTTGKCGNNTLTVCGILLSYSCKDTSGTSHTYTCKHDSGSQTGPESETYSTCTLSSSTESEEGCYRANNRLNWFTKSPGSPWTKVSVAEGNCGGCVSGYEENDDGDCVKKPSSDPSSSKPSPSTPSNPSSSDPTPSNPSSSDSAPSTPSSDNVNVNENPKTGSIAIFTIWVVALATLGYAFWYFKKVRFE